MNKCWICEKPDIPLFDINNALWKYDEAAPKRVYCAECLKKEQERIKARDAEYSKLKTEIMFERALLLLERQSYNLNKARDVIDQLQEYHRENPDKFDSADEILAAIVLIDNEIKIKVHALVGKHEVDFMLPEHKIVFEVDGIMHGLKLGQDRKRDIEIRQQLGPEWEVVRIGTEHIEKNPHMLIDAIFAIKEKKQKLRKDHGGRIPAWYSKKDGAPL